MNGRYELKSPLERICAACGETFQRQIGTKPKYCGHACYITHRFGNSPSIKKRLADMSVIKEGGCHEWTGALTVEGGYGVLNVNGRPTRAHRLSYEEHIGPIQQGLFVCHSCDNPKCINPNHLFLGTCAENAHDAATKGRLCIGEAVPQSKLTAEKVLDIRHRYGSGARLTHVARDFGVSRAAILKVIRRETWKHI